jgi:dTDP-4-dehydrorhamnose 3,5-epimerase
MPFVFNDTSLQDVQLIAPEIFGDERWFFMETYKHNDFVQAGINNIRVQDNHSRSAKGTLRWLHIQTQHTQAKLIRVTQWSAYDVVVDMRLQSSTYGQRAWFELSAENKLMLYIPKWFAHGFLTLEEDTELVYKCDDIYDPNHETWLIRNDPTLNINRSDYLYTYHISHPILSSKDSKNPTRIQLSQAVSF